MANPENLVSLADRTTKEKREIAIQGGIASGIVRKEKATMKKTLEMLLESVPNIKGNEDKKTFRELSTEGLIKGAIDGKAENYKTMLEVLGEMVQESSTPDISINIIDNSKLEETMYKGDEE